MTKQALLCRIVIRHFLYKYNTHIYLQKGETGPENIIHCNFLNNEYY